MPDLYSITRHSFNRTATFIHNNADSFVPSPECHYGAEVMRTAREVDEQVRYLQRVYEELHEKCEQLSLATNEFFGAAFAYADVYKNCDLLCKRNRYTAQ